MPITMIITCDLCPTFLRDKIWWQAAAEGWEQFHLWDNNHDCYNDDHILVLCAKCADERGIQ